MVLMPWVRMARRRSWIRDTQRRVKPILIYIVMGADGAKALLDKGGGGGEGGEGGDVSDVLLSVVQCVNMFILPYKHVSSCV